LSDVDEYVIAASLIEHQECTDEFRGLSTNFLGSGSSIRLGSFGDEVTPSFWGSPASLPAYRVSCGYHRAGQTRHERNEYPRFRLFAIVPLSFVIPTGKWKRSISK
jgi:hypothetical protein